MSFVCRSLGVVILHRHFAFKHQNMIMMLRIVRDVQTLVQRLSTNDTRRIKTMYGTYITYQTCPTDI